MVVLYPTETVYGLGVNPFDKEACAALRALKGRDENRLFSWLVERPCDIAEYALVSEVANRIIERLLPGPLTVVLPVQSKFLEFASALGTIGFRVSADPVVMQVLRQCGAPLTSTSANVSGKPTRATVPEILAQFGDRASEIGRIVDDGPRTGTPSTVVRVMGDEVEILRLGAISQEEIMDAAEKPLASENITNWSCALTV